MRPDRMFPGDSELARLMRAFDWAKTDVGPPETWPTNLRAALGICLSSRFPMNVWWGPSLTLFYNDGYIPFLGPKHPAVLGRSGREAWAEIWHQIGPMIDGVLAHGTASWSEDIEMFFARAVPKEEVYITFSFSPIWGEDKVEGMFCACTETTEKIVGNRRLDVLRELGVSTTVARSGEAAITAARDVLAREPRIVPFAAIYVGNDQRVELAACVGHDRLPRAVRADDPPERWQLGTAMRTQQTREIDLVGARVYAGPWPEPLERALVIPMRAHDALLGLFVAGVSPRRPFDAGYHSFLELVATHIATSIADARAYQQERERAEKLAEVDRAKTTFLANVSHAFRTPLTLLLGPMEQLLARVDPALRPQVEVIQRNGLRLHKLVNTLLDFARIEDGRARASYAPHDLAALTADLASSFRSAIESAGLTFTVDCPPLGEPIWVDREMWEKIVLNLLSNALKFTFDGRIAVSLRDEHDHVRLDVTDTGDGIPADQLPRVFDRFHRIEGQRARSFEGSGIGLSLVQELVRMHGGEIAVHSQPRRGTTFTVRIPRGARRNELAPVATDVSSSSPEAYVEEAASWSLPTVVPHDSSGRPRILLAEDNADMRFYVSQLLERDWDVTAVADGAAAVASAIAQPPDLVLTDVMMPELDGFAVLRRLREHAATRHVPIILLSARAGEEARVEGLEAGADDYLIKPFSARELIARVRANLELSRARLSAGQAAAESRTKDELIGILAHELRNPLSPIATTLQLIQMTGRADPDQIAMLRRQVHEMTRLVDGLLDMSRIVLGKLQLSLAPIDLAEVVRRAVDMVTPLFDGHSDLELRVRRGVFVRGDVARLAQVVANLLHNAIKFSPRNSPILVTVERRHDRGRIEVIDRGQGIATDMLDRMFDMFVEQPQSLERPRGGLGIGLAVARGIVERHGGRLRGFSEGEGKGSVFTVEVPLAERPAAASEEPLPTPAPHATRILVVDDNVEAAAALRLGLTMLGYHVEVAHDGPSALEVADRFQPDIALLDIRLHGMDGYELGRRLRERRDVRLFAVSGYARAADFVRSREAGFVDHFVKPIDLRMIARVLGGS